MASNVKIMVRFLFDLSGWSFWHDNKASILFVVYGCHFVEEYCCCVEEEGEVVVVHVMCRLDSRSLEMCQITFPLHDLSFLVSD